MRENEQESTRRQSKEEKQECRRYQTNIVKKPRVVPLPRDGESNPTLKKTLHTLFDLPFSKKTSLRIKSLQHGTLFMQILT